MKCDPGADEITVIELEQEWNAKFTDIFFRNDAGAILSIDLGRLSEIERLAPRP